MRGEQPGLLLDLAGRDGGGRPGDRRGSRRVRPEPVGRGVGVALLDLDVGDREAELLRDDLGERGLVTLALDWTPSLASTLPVGWTRISPRVEHLEAEDVEL